MLAGMGFLIKKKQIFNMVIQRIAVYMMDFLVGLKRAFQILFHNMSVFGDFKAFASYVAIKPPLRVFINDCSAFICGVIRTIKVAGFRSKFHLAASSTSLFRFCAIISYFERLIAYYTIPSYQTTHTLSIANHLLVVNYWKPTRKKVKK